MASSNDDVNTILGNMVVNSFPALAVGLGSKLGLFELLATFDSPKTSQEIADAGNFKERFEHIPFWIF